MGRGLRCMVHMQIPELWTRRDRRIVYPREVERSGNTKVSGHLCDAPRLLSLINRRRKQIRWLVGTNRGYQIPDGSEIHSNTWRPRIPAIKSSRPDRRIAPGVVTDL